MIETAVKTSGEITKPADGKIDSDEEKSILIKNIVESDPVKKPITHFQIEKRLQSIERCESNFYFNLKSKIESFYVTVGERVEIYTSKITSEDPNANSRYF